MTEDYFSILPPAVRAAVEDMLQTGATMQAGFAALRSDGDAVITGSWKGAAANAVNTVWQDWETDFGKHIVQVEHGPEVLADATEQFESMDSPGGN